MGFDIRLITAALNGFNNTTSTNGADETEKDIKVIASEAAEVSGEQLLADGIDTNGVFGAKFSNPISSNAPVFSDDDLAEMFDLAGVSETEATFAAATPEALNALEEAGFNLEELEEIFEEEPEVVAQTIEAFNNGSASRISRDNQQVAALVENAPEGTTPQFFEAFMYAINEDRFLS